MALRLRGRTQILDSSLALGKFKGVTSGTIIGNSGSGPAALSSSDARTVLGLSTSDSVAFGSLSSTDITIPNGKSLDTSGGTLTLAYDQISGDKVNGGDISGDLTLSGSQITVDNTLSAGSFSSSSVNIDGGNIDGTAIGNDSASSGSFTSLIASGGGSSAIDNVPVGSSTPNSGAFTSLSASTSLSVNSNLSVNSDGDLTTSGTINTTDSSGLSITGNLTVGGNLTINGDNSVNNVSNLSVEDSLLSLASGNDSSDSLDIGFHALTSNANPNLDSVDYPALQSANIRNDNAHTGGQYWMEDATTFGGNDYLYQYSFSEIISISGNGQVMAVLDYVERYKYYSMFTRIYINGWRIYFYDWNSSTESWDKRDDYISFSASNSSQTQHNNSFVYPANDQIYDFKLNYDGNKILVLRYKSTSGSAYGNMHFYEWQDTDSDGVKDEWVQIHQRADSHGFGSNVGRTINIAWTEKSNGDILLIEAMPYMSSYKGRIKTILLDSNFSTAGTDYGVIDDFYGANNNDYLGSEAVSLSRDGNTLALSRVHAGEADIYSWDSTNEEWSLQDTIVDPNNNSYSDRFSVGLSLNSDGTKIAIGSYLKKGPNSDTDDSLNGRVYFYKYNSTSEEWESDSDRSSITGELMMTGSFPSMTDDANTVVIGNPCKTSLISPNQGDYNYYNSDEYDDHPRNMNGVVRQFSYNSSNSTWNEVYDSDFILSIYAGLFRDATNGKFRLFNNSQQNDWSTNVVDTSATGYSVASLVANLEGDVTGDLTGNADSATAFATARDFSITGDFTASAVSFDGSSNVILDASIDNGVVVVSDLSTDMVITSSETFTDSDVLIPTSAAAKAYILSQISSSSDASAENGDFKIADSSGDFSKSERVFQKSTISSSDVSNGYVAISTDIDTNFEFLAEVYLNGQKIRSGTSTQVGNSEREYYFDTSSSGSHKIYLNSSIMKSGDKLEIIHFILS